MTALRTVRAGLLCALVTAGTFPNLATAATPVRVGDHPGFGRVVFDLPAEATSHVVVEGDRVLMVFQGAGAVIQPGDLPRNVRAIHTGADTATLDLQPGAKARPIRIGDRLVIDVLDAGSAQSPARQNAASGRTAPAKPVPVKAVPNRPAEPEPSAAPVAAIPEPQVPTVVTPIVAPAPAPVQPVAPALPAAAASTPVAREALPAAAVPADRQEPSSFVIKADSDVGAAAFRRGAYGLIVLDRRLAEQAAAPGVRWNKGPTSTVLQVPLPPEMALRLSRTAVGWTVEQVAGWAPEGLVQTADSVGTALAMPRPSRSVAVLDPVSGGTLLVGAALSAEGGVPGGRRNPAYRLLPSWLGIAVEPSSDQVDLRPATAGFVLVGGGPASSAGGSMLSRRFDLPDEPVPALTNRLRAQLASAATAAPRARSVDRLAAAQSMIALGMGAEAQALVQQVAADDPQQAADAQTSGVAAVAAVLAGRLEEAGALDDPRLDGTAEIGLWRGLRDRKLGKDTEAGRKLGSMAPLALSYPASLRRLVWADVAEAAVESGVAVPAEQLPAYAKALLLERNGDVDGALAAYDALAGGSDRLAQVRGTARAAELRLASARMSPADAASVMERQSYAWRGDGMEYAFRLRAAELRSAAQEWRPALEALRAIGAAYPDRASAIQRRKVDVMQAMLTTMGAGLSAVDLVLLAADYQDCLPSGQAGSAMARLLADKLAALDLPARTIPVLQGLVRATQAGEARAEFGVHLGELLLDGGDAPGAVAALDASAAPDLSALLHERRQLLLARARARAGDLTAAAAGLVELGTERADDLRATLLGKSGDWRGSLSALGDLVAKTVPKEGRLNEGEQDLLVRQADAAARAGAGGVLQQLRPSAARLEGARADVFRLVTAAPLGETGDLPRSGLELAAARGMPQRLQAAGLR